MAGRGWEGRHQQPERKQSPRGTGDCRCVELRSSTGRGQEVHSVREPEPGAQLLSAFSERLSILDFQRCPIWPHPGTYRVLE